MDDMAESIGSPPVMFLDLRPLIRPMLLIRSHEIAEQVSRQSKTWPYSLPKSDTMLNLIPLLGERSIVMSYVRDSRQTVQFTISGHLRVTYYRVRNGRI